VFCIGIDSASGPFAQQATRDCSSNCAHCGAYRAGHAAYGGARRRTAGNTAGDPSNDGSGSSSDGMFPVVLDVIHESLLE